MFGPETLQQSRVRYTSLSPVSNLVIDANQHKKCANVALQSVTDYCVFTEGNFNKHQSARHGHTRARNYRVEINQNAHQDKCYMRLCVLEAAHHHKSPLTSTCRRLQHRSKSAFKSTDTEYCRWFNGGLCLASHTGVLWIKPSRPLVLAA